MSDPLSKTFGGLPVVESPMVPEGTAYIIPGRGLAVAPGFAAIVNVMPETSDSFLQKLLDRARREAVVLLPLVYAVIAAVPEHTAITDWRVWGPVALGVLLRQVFTSPTHEVDAKERSAFKAGVAVGKNLGPRP